MLKTLIEKEIRDIIGSTKFAITFAVCALLIIMAFYTGATRHKLYVTHHQASQAEQLRSMEGITDWFDVEGTRLFLPPRPLASLISGISNDIGRTADVTGRGSIPTDDSRYNEDPLFAVFRFIDLDFVFTVILSLFAILLGYDAISGEKERGTLKLSFANAVSRSTYLAGKLLGAFIALTMAILIPIAIGIFLFLLMGISMTEEEWVRLLLIILIGLMSFGVFLSLSICVSAMTHRSANSFLVLLVVWVLCVHIVPRASVLLAARSVEVPSLDEISYKRAALNQQLSREFRESLKEGQASFLYSSSTIDGNVLMTLVDSLSQERSRKATEFSARLEEERANRQGVQEKIAFSIARISPVTSFSLASAALAGTSLELKDRFIEQAHDYQEKFAAFYEEKTGMSLSGGLRIQMSADGDTVGEPEKPQSIDPTEMPQFAFTEPELTEIVQTTVMDFGLLAVFTMLFFAGAFVSFLRYDVR
ncbi:MAG: ABC transporter permease subunit [candidate division Zixibacteria bacterium]|nr:ABC transporter permease subunit [candidate division Zixibacteria bacterium]